MTGGVASPAARDFAEVLLTADVIGRRVAEMGRQITRDYAGREPYLIPILNGAFLFVADLIRSIDLRCQIGFLGVSSYGDSTESSGTVRIIKDLQKDINDRDVLIVEDIVDTGLTMNYLVGILSARRPRSLKTVTLLSKPECRRVDVPLDYVGFEIPNKFVVGYGLDYQQRYRNIPFIGVLSPSAIDPAGSTDGGS